KTTHTFNITLHKFKHKNINLLFNNQPLYNPLIPIFLIYPFFITTNPKEISPPILLYIIPLPIYPPLSTNITIFFKQPTFPLFPLISILS
ncbi:DUF1304 family protein, partial [Staphylococcus aureus]|uniref:DUF1304 family protein n=1 Tax=Staphylococcus aureus TaxID=1280 RepID=UPI00119E4796